MLVVHSNGSKLDGDAPDLLTVLLEVLDNYLLDPEFAPYIVRNPCGSVDLGRGRFKSGERIYPEQKAVRFVGTFIDISHGFRIDTDEPKLVRVLTAAIRANKRTIEEQEILF